MRRIDQVLLISICLIMVYWILILIFVDLTGPLVSLYYWIQSLSLFIGYPGAFLVSLLGNVTVLFPFPYIAVIFLLGGASAGVSGPFFFDPWLLGIIGGIGATLGEMTGYLLGRFGSRFVNQEQRSGFLDFVKKYPRMTPFVLWFLALTPVPDDVVVIPLGVARYPFQKVLIPQLIGKCMFLIIIAWAGRLGLSFVESFVIGDPTNPLTKSIEVVALLILVIGIYLVLRIDWSKVKFRKDKSESRTADHEKSDSIYQ
ncbi:MAG: YqaA family protein [Candidatus Thorarchaeota archaeon]